MENQILRDEVLGNGDHFLNLLKTETARIKALVKTAENELETDEAVPEDASGKLRVAVGKANMLLKKKFVQFEDLCLNNLGRSSKIQYPVTPEDLAGYWDTIVLQLLHVYKLFDEVETLRKNKWEEPDTLPNLINDEKLPGESILSETSSQSERSTKIT